MPQLLNTTVRVLAKEDRLLRLVIGGRLVAIELGISTLGVAHFCTLLQMVRQVDVGFVQAHGRVVRIVLGYHLHNFGALSSVFLEIARHDYEIRTQFAANETGHGRSDAIFASYVVGGGL